VSGIYQELADRIAGEIPELERLVQRIEQRWLHGKAAPGQQDVYLESVALNLHGFYSGIERLFELVARHVDRSEPSGETWHRDLLQQMVSDIADARPAVISNETAATLDEFRRFRHLVRNVYTFNLVPEKMENLVLILPVLWTRLHAELLATADYLQALADAT
jgi:hypothetical protein